MLEMVNMLDSENMFACKKEKYNQTLFVIWSYKERWDFSTTEALCMNWFFKFSKKKKQFPPFISQIWLLVLFISPFFLGPYCVYDAAQPKNDILF